MSLILRLMSECELWCRSLPGENREFLDVLGLGNVCVRVMPSTATTCLL